MTDKERIELLEDALVNCFDAAMPQAMPWTGTKQEKAEYAAKTLATHLQGINRLLNRLSKNRTQLEKELAGARADIKLLLTVTSKYLRSHREGGGHLFECAAWQTGDEKQCWCGALELQSAIELFSCLYKIELEPAASGDAKIIVDNQ